MATSEAVRDEYPEALDSAKGFVSALVASAGFWSIVGTVVFILNLR